MTEPAEKRYTLTGRNWDRGLTFTETVWAPSYPEAVRRATLARRWLNKVPAHVWTGKDE